MSESQNPVTPPTDEELSSIRAEKNALENHREVQHRRFRWSFFLGLFLAVVGTVVFSGNQGYWSFAPAVISLCAATTFYAMERGQHAAWGVLSLPGLALLNLMPDRNAERLDELDRRITGKPAKRISEDRLSQAFWLPMVTLVSWAFAADQRAGAHPPGLYLAGIMLAPIGLFHAISLVFDANRNQRSLVLPIAVAVWAGFWTFVAADMLYTSPPKVAP